MDNSEQLEGENIICDQKMEGGSSKKEQPVGIKRGAKIQKLTAVDIGRQYWDCLKEIGNGWRRSWFQIFVTILIEQKKDIGYSLSLLFSLSLSLSLSLYIYIYIYIKLKK